MSDLNNSPNVNPRTFCVHELVAQQAARSPTAVAIGSSAGVLNYFELEAGAMRVREFLRQKGVLHGDLIGICLERTHDTVVALLGVLKIGAAYVPLDPAFPSGRLEYMAADAGLRFILTTKSFSHLVLSADVPRLFVEEIDMISGALKADDLPLANAKDLAYVQYTSGSTGKPKGVEVTHGALSNFLCSMREEPGCSATDVLLSVTTLSFDISGLELFLPLIVGGRVELTSAQEAADGRLLRERIEQCQPTMMQATPATWQMLINAGWKGSTGLVALCGGEGLSRKLADDLLIRTAALWNMYGPTETTIWSTLARIEAGEGVISIGKPIANTKVFVLDECMQPTPVGIAGELYIGGNGVARGYRNLPVQTAERFVPDPFSALPGTRLFRSGDLVRALPDGNHVHLGRLDSQVKIRGFRIELEEIQLALARHSDIEQVTVKAIDDNVDIKRLVAYVVSRAGTTLNAHQLRAFLRLSLPEFMVPSNFVFLKSFPLTSNNKLDTKALPVPLLEPTVLEPGWSGPRNRLETQILAIWRQNLGADNLGIHDSFFDAGGNSLMAARLLAQVEQVIGYRLPLDILLQVPTVAQMVEHMSSGGWRPSQHSLVVIQRGGRKFPFFAIPGVGGNVLMFARLARLMGPDQPFYGLQARGVDNYEEPFESLTEMASQYVTEIRSIQSDGPYFIGGSCTGGVVAYEMAQQLVMQGEQVTLAILDSEHPSAYRMYLQVGSSLWRVFFFWSRGIAYVRSLSLMSPRQWPEFLKTKMRNAFKSVLVRDTPAFEKTEFQLRDVYQKNMATVARYQVREYPGTLLNIVAKNRQVESGKTDTRRCWDSLALAGSQQASIAAEDSGQLFVSPHVEVLAKLLRELSETLPQNRNKNND